jgi:hypothetical protein
MPRNSSGTYTLPAGNPVVDGTDITAAWGNTTMQDIAAALTDSLSRTGQGGMAAPFLFFNGTVSNPGMGFVNQPSTGIFLNATGDMRVTVGGAALMRFNTGVEILDGSVWKAPLLQGESEWDGPIGIGMAPGSTSLSVADNLYVGLADGTLGLFIGEIAGTMFITAGDDPSIGSGALAIYAAQMTLGASDYINIGNDISIRMQVGNKIIMGDVSLGFELATAITINALFGDTNILAIKTLLGSNVFTALNDGTVRLPVTASTTTASAANLFINSSTGALARSTSSARYKENILPYTRGLTTVAAMKPKTFNGKGESITRAGFIAEDFDELGLTEFVNYNEEGLPDSIDYPNLTALFVKALQELSAQVDSLISP